MVKKTWMTSAQVQVDVGRSSKFTGLRATAGFVGGPHWATIEVESKSEHSGLGVVQVLPKESIRKGAVAGPEIG